MAAWLWCMHCTEKRPPCCTQLRVRRSAGSRQLLLLLPLLHPGQRASSSRRWRSKLLGPASSRKGSGSSHSSRRGRRPLNSQQQSSSLQQSATAMMCHQQLRMLRWLCSTWWTAARWSSTRVRRLPGLPPASNTETLLLKCGGLHACMCSGNLNAAFKTVSPLLVLAADQPGPVPTPASKVTPSRASWASVIPRLLPPRCCWSTTPSR